MRKKLLALLMCATMVLGSSAVAFAAQPTTDDYANATKVLTKGSDITKEFESKTVKTTVYVNGEGGMSYAFYADDASATGFSSIKLDADSNQLLYVGDATDIAATSVSGADERKIYVGATVAADKIGRNISAVLTDYIATTNLDKTKKLSELGLDKIIIKATDGYGVDHIILATAVDATKTGTQELAAGNNDNWTSVELPTKTVGATKNVYKTSDGYSFATAPTKKNLFAGVTAKSGDTTYVYTFEAITAADNDYDDLWKATAAALNEGTISSDARAVRVKLYQYGVTNNVPYLTQITYPAGTVSLPVANDVLSRVKLNTEAVDAFFVSDTLASDTNIGTYRVVAPASSSLDASAAYKTFDLPLNFASSTGYVLIFDQGEAESNNDGVSETTTTTTAAAATSAETAATSPKTGDVAPIAALAVVMMGACGAMVAASKKRA
jgi:hypothetical protein